MVASIRMIVLTLLISLSSTLIFTTFAIGDYAITQEALFMQIKYAMLGGVIIGIMNMLYEWTTWPFIWQISVHFSSVFITVLAIGYFAGWYDYGMSMVIVVLQIISVYVVIWFGARFLLHNEVHEINEAIRKNRGESL